MEGLSAARGRPLTARYALDEVLARGGVGEVWRGRDLRLGRPVAVKVLHGAQADPRFRDRFRNEARHAAGLSHPNIAAVFDYGEEAADDGDEPTPFLVMELVEGESLADLLARRGRLGVGRTLSILRQLSSALAAAHEAGVVHRDVKPANVLVRRDGVVKITDFGIAASAASAALTETGQVVGTARYLSPEQARGRRGTPASDVYALGLVGYECLAGRPAFDGPDPIEVAARQVAEPPPPLPPDVPEQVRGLVGTATAKDPAHRIPDGAALRDAVDRLLESDRRAARSAVPLRAADPTALRAATVPGSPTAGRRGATAGASPLPPVPASRPPRPARRRRWWPVPAGGGLLCALAAALVLVGVPGASGSANPVRVRIGSGAVGAPASTGGSATARGGALAGVVAVPAPDLGASGAAAVPTGPSPAGVRGTTRGDGAGTSRGAPRAAAGEGRSASRRGAETPAPAAAAPTLAAPAGGAASGGAPANGTPGQVRPSPGSSAAAAGTTDAGATSAPTGGGSGTESGSTTSGSTASGSTAPGSGSSGQGPTGSRSGASGTGAGASGGGRTGSGKPGSGRPGSGSSATGPASTTGAGAGG